MNGDRALLCPKTINAPTRMSMTMMGVSHHAFLTLRKSHNSPNNDLFPAIGTH